MTPHVSEAQFEKDIEAALCGGGPDASEQGQIVIEDSVAPEEYAEIGGFKVLAALGEGGMGRVYLAREGRSGRDVALKVLRGTLATDGEFLQRFQQEAESITGHRHENVVRSARSRR